MILTICAFRVLNTRQWSMVKRSSLKRCKNEAQKFPKQVKVKRDCVINTQNYNFNQFKHKNVDSLQTLRINLRQP